MTDKDKKEIWKAIARLHRLYLEAKQGEQLLMKVFAYLELPGTEDLRQTLRDAIARTEVQHEQIEAEIVEIQRKIEDLT